MTSYDTMLRTFLASLKEEEEHKKRMILRLAEQLEKEKIVAMDTINQKLCEDLSGYVTKQWIGRCLPKKFKDAEQLAIAQQKGKQNAMKLLVKVGDQGIESSLGDLKDEVNRVANDNEKESSKEFHNELKESLDKRDINLEDINQNVFKELQSKMEELDDLNQRYYELRKEFGNLDGILQDFRDYTGYWVKYDSNFKIIGVKEDDD